MIIPLETYRDAVRLDKPFNTDDTALVSKEEIPRLIQRLVDLLLNEAGTLNPVDLKNQRTLLQHLLTVRPPLPLPARFWDDMDRLQAWEAGQRTITDGSSLPQISQSLPGSQYRAARDCSLWQGDITTLKTDAIVNAANADLLGCFAPFHGCIDNAIHTAAGPRLRGDCQMIMGLQKNREKTGQAKITRGYHLPARYVLHTVGPIYDRTKSPTVLSGQLADSYRTCLGLGARINGPEGIRTIAFCSISTGVFGFPPDLAARTALETVAEWMDDHPGRLKVIFNLFSDVDVAVYQGILSGMK